MFLLWNPPAYKRPPDWTYFNSERKAALDPKKKGTPNGECACMIQMQPKRKKKYRMDMWIQEYLHTFFQVTTVYRFL